MLWDALVTGFGMTLGGITALSLYCVALVALAAWVATRRQRDSEIPSQRKPDNGHVRTRH